MAVTGRETSRTSTAREGVTVLVVTVLLACLACLGCATPSQQAQKRNGPVATPPGRIAALRSPGPPARVVLISVAGLQASDFLMPDGYVAGPEDRVRMPHLAKLAREGVVGERAFPPSPGSTYASHASLVTGQLPSHHGVVADARLDDDGSRSTPYWDSRVLEGAALWDAAIGRGVLALDWPTTLGARIELVVPDAEPADGGQSWLDFKRGVTSPILMAKLDAIAEDTLGQTNAALGSKRSPMSWPTVSERDAAMSEVACLIALSDRDPRLWLIRLRETQVVMRTSGIGSTQVAAALGRIDDEIGSIVDCLEEAGKLADTAIFVVGDVAFRPVHTRIDPNVALVKAGLIGRDPRSSTGIRSWLAISQSHGRSAYVYARDANNAVAARKILELEAEHSGAYRVVPASELSRGGVDPQAWFGLAAAPGFEIGNGLTRPQMRPAEVRSSPGALRLDGDSTNAVGFVAWGRGIRRQVRLSELELIDVAPTIAKLFGLRLSDAVDGRPISGILRAEIPLPPPGPKRIGTGNGGDVDRTLRDLGGGR